MKASHKICKHIPQESKFDKRSTKMQFTTAQKQDNAETRAIQAGRQRHWQLGSTYQAGVLSEHNLPHTTNDVFRMWNCTTKPNWPHKLLKNIDFSCGGRPRLLKQ
jgi:hypothetical protein